MKIRLKIILSFFTLIITSCDNQVNRSMEKENIVEIEKDSSEVEEKNLLNNPIFLEHWHELILIQTDDRYGEWGGDTYVIRLHKNSKSDKYFADYIEYKGSDEPPAPPKDGDEFSPWYIYKPVIKQKKDFQINENQIQIFYQAITSLIEQKLSIENRIAHSGIKNEIILKDSTLIIKDYPSFEWEEFKKLKRIILEE